MTLGTTEEVPVAVEAGAQAGTVAVMTTVCKPTEDGIAAIVSAISVVVVLGCFATVTTEGLLASVTEEVLPGTLSSSTTSTTLTDSKLVAAFWVMTVVVVRLV